MRQEVNRRRGNGGNRKDREWIGQRLNGRGIAVGNKDEAVEAETMEHGVRAEGI